MAEGKAKVKASSGLNVRSGAGTNHSKIGWLSNGTTVSYYSESNGWLQIKYNGKTGDVSKQYTSITQAATGGSTASTSNASGTVQVTASALNVRAGAGTGYKVLGTLTNGQKVSYSQESNGWLKISYNNQTGWISKKYTKAASGSSGGGSNNSGGGASTSTSTIYVNTTTLNVRSGAGTGNAKIGTVSYGQKLTMYSSSNGWAKIAYGSGYGWVSMQYTSSKAPSTGGGSGGSTGAGGAKSDSALAKKSRQVAAEFGTTGWCAKGVSTAVQRTHGFYPGGNGNQIGAGLLRSGMYKEVSLTLQQGLNIPGVIFSWQKTGTTAGQKYGHTAVSQGNGKDSTCDFYEYNTHQKSGKRTGLKVYSLK